TASSIEPFQTRRSLYELIVVQRLPSIRYWLFTIRSTRLLLVARQDVVRAFPWPQVIEAAEFLRQFHRLVDDALAFFVVADFDEAGEREVLSQRIAVEAVVG